MLDSKKQKIGIGLGILVLICVAFGSGYLMSGQFSESGLSGKTRTVVDGAGREVVMPKDVNRIISLVSGVTGHLYEMGEHDKVVGVTQALPYPTKYYYPETEVLAKDVGGIANINVEEVVKLDPDVVLTTEFFLTNAKALEDRGIPVVAIRLNSLDDLVWNVRFLGSIVGKTEEGNKLADKMQANINSVGDKTSSLDKTQMKKVYVESSSGKTYGASSYCTASIIKAGGINIYGDSPIKMPMPSYEYIIQQNPDNIIIFLVSKDYQEFLVKSEAAINEIKTRPGWSDVSAVKNNRFCVIDDRYLDFGPNHYQSIVAMGKFLHPELFKDIPYPEFIYTTVK